MVIDNLYVKDITVFKSEAQSPLIVDADAPLTLAIAAQRFKAIAGRDAQKIQCGGRIDLL